MPREIEVNWTTSNGAGKVSVMYFNAAIAVATQRTALQTFLSGIMGAIDSGTSYTIATAGREWDSNTGALTGAWTEASAKTGVGTVGGEPVPDAIQILFRWGTGAIANGRFVAGRTFIPGCARVNDLDGNLDNAIAASIQTTGQAFATSGATPVVWHRPVSGSGGSEHQMNSCNVWREFAVLRRRRY